MVSWLTAGFSMSIDTGARIAIVVAGVVVVVVVVAPVAATVDSLASFWPAAPRARPSTSIASAAAATCHTFAEIRRDMKLG